MVTCVGLVVFPAVNPKACKQLVKRKPEVRLPDFRVV